MFKKVYLFLAIFVFTVIFLYSEQASAHKSIPDGNATFSNNFNPYEVDRDSWNKRWNIRGDRGAANTSGRKLVYDVYEGKTNHPYKQKWRIQKRKFPGQPEKNYLVFWGWSALQGYHHHEQRNQATYILLYNPKTREELMYKAEMSNLDASEDMEYLRANSDENTVYNPCPNNGTSASFNKRSDQCNMYYKWVGFKAWIPLEDLFTNHEKGEWLVYLVKNVEGHVVYTPLIVPFQFEKLLHGYGRVILDSGVNHNQLIMNTSGVVRRAQPRVNNPVEYGQHFVHGQKYTRVTHDEGGYAAIWYGVRSPHDGGATRWTSSPYWTFGGAQAVLSYELDNDPPTHISHSIKNYRYKNGNDYWVRPNDEPIVVLRQYDAHPGNKYQYLRLTRSGIDVRARHDFTNNSATNISNVSTFDRINEHVGIHYANRTENSNGYGRVEWHVIPRTHGHNYNIQYHYTDLANNAFGYDTKSKHGQNAGETGMRLRVDGVAPTIQFRNSNDTSDFDERDWSDKEIVVRLKFSDSHSGYKRSRYAWTQSPNTPSSNEWSSWQTSANYLVRKSEKGTWYLHVQAEDNVGNVRTVSKGEYKFNHKPEIKLTYSPNKIFEGDTVTLTAVPTDEDGDLLTVIIEEYVDGEWKLLKREEKVKPGQSVIHKIRVDARDYIIRATAIDDANQSGEDQVGFAVIPLEIKGFVEHTDDWKAIHEANEHDEDMFFAGEIFKTKALVTDHVIEKVTVEFMGEQINDDIMRFTEEMQPNPHPLYVADVFRTEMGAPSTRLKNGPVYFLFTAEWKNGVVKHDLVVVNIIDGAYNAFNFHRTN